MLKPITEIMGARLMDLDKSQVLGTISNWVINPEAKKISAFIVKPLGIFSKSLAVSTLDVIEYGPQLVVIKNQQALVTPSELVHLPKLIKSKHHVLGSPVVTQSGKKLGVVENILFETSDSTIQKIYVQPHILGFLHQPDLIIGADKIVSIEQKRIVITDNGDNLAAIRETSPAPTVN